MISQPIPGAAAQDGRFWTCADWRPPRVLLGVVGESGQ